MINNGWDGVTPVEATITVNPNVVIGANNTGSYALTIVGPFPDGSKLTLVNDGYIVGAGGNGGAATSLQDSGGSTGGAGGPAIHAAYAVTIVNNAVIGGGGGGGFGGFLTGGGGGAGSPPGPGWGNGIAGSLMNGGNGGWYVASKKSQGCGVGGNAGQSGTYWVAWAGQGGAGLGATDVGVYTLASWRYGGAAGACVDGNSFVTWTPTSSSQLYGALNG